MKIAFCGIISCIILTGCNVLPTVQYREIKKDSDMDGMADIFYFRATKINLSQKTKIVADNSGAENTVVNFTLTATPIEYTNMRIGIKPVQTWNSKTNIGITKIENTDLPKSIDVEASDLTVQRLTDSGKLLVTLASTGAGVNATDTCDNIRDNEEISVIAQLPDRNESQLKPLVGKSCAQISYGPVAPDAIERSALPQNSDTSSYYYSACRDAEIKILGGYKNEVIFHQVVRVNDPNYLQQVQLPFKGSVSHHSQCGVSVVTQKASSDVDSVAIAQALAAQAKSIRDAIEAARK